MPGIVAEALRADGWWLRSEIVWHKPNPMPESVTDRPTSAHEKVFLLSKSARYFYDAEAVRQPSTPESAERQKYAKNGLARRDDSVSDSGIAAHSARVYGSGEVSGSNLRNVWTIATHAFPGAHFATMPPALVEPCIKAGTSARGVCGACGAPWVREVEKDIRLLQETNNPKAASVGQNSRGDNFRHSGNGRASQHVTTTGWHPTCDCNVPVHPAVVLDPFAGAGTVGLVAQRLGRAAILIEINHEYAAMAESRIKAETPTLPGLAVS